MVSWFESTFSSVLRRLWSPVTIQGYIQEILTFGSVPLKKCFKTSTWKMRRRNKLELLRKKETTNSCPWGASLPEHCSTKPYKKSSHVTALESSRPFQFVLVSWVSLNLRFVDLDLGLLPSCVINGLWCGFYGTMVLVVVILDLKQLLVGFAETFSPKDFSLCSFSRAPLSISIPKIIWEVDYINPWRDWGQSVALHEMKPPCSGIVFVWISIAETQTVLKEGCSRCLFCKRESINISS